LEQYKAEWLADKWEYLWDCLTAVQMEVLLDVKKVETMVPFLVGWLEMRLVDERVEWMVLWTVDKKEQ
jgi:hypothetical protein